MKTIRSLKDTINEAKSKFKKGDKVKATKEASKLTSLSNLKGVIVKPIKGTVTNPDWYLVKKENGEQIEVPASNLEKMNEAEDKKTEYDVFFEKKLKEWGVKSPEDLSEEEKKRFFDEVDAEWEADDEEDEDDEMNENLEEGQTGESLITAIEATLSTLKQEISKEQKKRAENSLKSIEQLLSSLKKIDILENNQ